MAKDEVEKLKEELAILRTYQAVAEHNLQQLGLSLQAAQKQGWVSKRAEVRRRRVEKQKAAEEAKWAEIERDGQWIRNERKKVGLPVDDPTPSPSEAAYRENVYNEAIKAKKRSLRNRVRRVSHQLLIAAALGKQYREATTADHSGHNVPGADPGTRLKHIPFDARSDSSLSATEAMARSFRNWANREKQNRSRSRSRSHTPSTVYASSRSTGPATTVSGSGSDSSFTDEDSGVVAAMALVYDADFGDGDGDNEEVDDDDDDDDNDDDDEYSGGIAGLNFNQVSEETKLTVCAMLATAGNTETEVMDWADILATTVAQALYGFPTPPPTASEPEDLGLDDQTGNETEGDGSSMDLSGEAKETLKSFQATPPQKTIDTNSNQAGLGAALFPSASQKKGQGTGKSTSRAEAKGKDKEVLKRVLQTHNIPPPTPPSVNDLPSEPPKKPTPRQASPFAPVVQVRSSAPPPSSHLPEKQARKRQQQKPQGYRPPQPDQTVWDPSLWHVNKTDYDDGVWAGKDPRFVQPKVEGETGWITWAEQERRFPRLDERLRLHSVRNPNPVIYDPSTVDTQIWDPLTRAIAEARTGKREPLHLGPVTMHSLARWAESGSGVEYSRDPLPQHGKDRKRPAPSTNYASAAAKKQKTAFVAETAAATPVTTGGGGLFGTYMGQDKNKERNNNRVRFAATPVLTPSPAVANQPVASILYPLKSPAANSFRSSFRLSPSSSSSSSSSASSKAAAAGVPDTPPGGFGSSALAGLKSARSWSGTTAAQAPLTPATPTVSLYGVPEEEEEEEEEEEDAQGEGGAISSGDRQKLVAFLDKIRARGTSQQGKRAATEEPSVSAIKKRWIAEDDDDDDEESVYPTTPLSSRTPKSVRFNVQRSESSGGPSNGMRDGARRALGRYGRTSSRRGPLPVR